jgi:membrane-associated phospholipid phosphatase
MPSIPECQRARSTRRVLPAALGTALLLVCARAPAQEAPPATPTSASSEADASSQRGFMADAKAYFTAPLHWDGSDWAWLGASVAAIGIAHHYDTDVRTHFLKTEGANAGTKSNDLEDFLPTIAVLGGTWLYAGIEDSSAGHRETYSMFEALVLGGITSEAFKFALGRQGPNDTDDPNQWFKGSGTFPSLHVTAAFAVGTVLAESGNDEFRWLRRLLGYGLGGGTAYLRLKHNQHWLSDTVAGAALGISTAHFTLNRHESYEQRFAVVPVPGGALLTYHLTLD